MQRSGSQSERLGAAGGSSFIAKSSASEHSMSTGVSASSSGSTLPRTLSTSVLRIKNRSTFWEKFWDERTRRDAWVPSHQNSFAADYIFMQTIVPSKWTHKSYNWAVLPIPKPRQKQFNWQTLQYYASGIVRFNFKPLGKSLALLRAVETLKFEYERDPVVLAFTNSVTKRCSSYNNRNSKKRKIFRTR